MKYELVDTFGGVARIDPLFGFLYHRFQNARDLGIAIGVLYGVIWIAAGLFVGEKYPSQYVGLFSTRELPYGSFLWLVVVPAGWTYYLWFPESVVYMVASLYKNGVIGVRKNQLRASREGHSVLLNRILHYWTKAGMTIVAVIGVLIVLWAYFLIFLPDETAKGGPTFWLASPWLTLVLGFLVAISSYVILQTVARILALAIVLYRFFKEEALNVVYISHPDRSGGLGALGQLTIRLGFFAILIGIWASWISLLPVGISGELALNTASVLLYLAYGTLAILNFFLLLWPAHAAMVRYKHRRLEPLSVMIQDVFRRLENEDADVETIHEELTLLGELYERASEMPEWPIPSSVIRRFSFVSSIPGLIGVLTSAYDLLQPTAPGTP